MDPVEDLKHEHEAILGAAIVMEHMARRYMEGGWLPDAHTTQLISFLTGFVHGCHHRKEEQFLLPLMARKSVEIEAGPVKALRSEHEAVAAFLVRIKEAHVSHDDHALAGALSRYAALLRRHIAKENEIVLPLVNALLREKERADLAEGFESVEWDLGGHRFHFEMEQMLAELQGIYGHAAAHSLR